MTAPGESRFPQVLALTRRLGLTRLYWVLRRVERRWVRGALRRALRTIIPHRVGLGPHLVPAGRHVDEETAAHLPVRLITVLSSDDRGLAGIVDHVAALQVSSLGFKPLFLTCSDEFAPFRVHGYLFEYLPPREDWQALGHAKPWEDYLAERVAEIRDTYRPDMMLDLTDGTRSQRVGEHVALLLAAPSTER